MLVVLVVVAAVAAAGLGWMLFEAQWVDLRELDVPVEGLPAELDGFAVLHLSDFHLGTTRSTAARCARRSTGRPGASSTWWRSPATSSAAGAASGCSDAPWRDSTPGTGSTRSWGTTTSRRRATRSAAPPTSPPFGTTAPPCWSTAPRASRRG